MKHTPSLCLHQYLMIGFELAEQLTVFFKEVASTYVVRVTKEHHADTKS